MSRIGLNTVKIAEISINSTSQEEVLKAVVQKVSSGQKLFIVTPNPEFIIFAKANPWFKTILNKADIAVPDGIGLIWASKILGKNIQERISGTDFMERLCQEAAKHGWTVYLLGGEEGVAQKTLAILKKRFPGLKGWADTGLKLDLSPNTYYLIPKQEITKVTQHINTRKPDFLFVAFGMGKQEKFIYNNWDELNVKLAMGVGGAFDYISGKIPRAPKWVQKTGLEWLFRLLRQPWRIRRQLTLLGFIWLIFKEKLNSLLRSL